MADQRAFAKKFRREIDETPKLKRRSGGAEVERDSEFMGIPYDPGLVGPTDLSTFAASALHLREPHQLPHLERLIRHSERVRSHKTWPDYIRDHFVSVDREPIEEQLRKHTPGSRSYMRCLSSLKKKLGSEAFYKTEWGQWLREWDRERDRLERLTRGITGLRVRKHGTQWGVEGDPLRHRFHLKKAAVAWGRHLAIGGAATYDELDRIMGRSGG